MPLEVAVISESAMGLGGAKQLAAMMNPPLEVSVEFDGACLAFRNANSQVVAVLQRPKIIGCDEDIPRCCDQRVSVPAPGQVWTEGFVPFQHAQQGLEAMMAVAIATDGQALVKGDLE